MPEKSMEAMSLQDCFEVWLAASHPVRDGVRNAERQPNDRKNHERALECVAAAEKGEAILARVSADRLAVSESVLRRNVEEGARQIAHRTGRKAPSPKTVANLTSCARAVRNVALGEMPKRESIRNARRRNAKPTLAKRPVFPSNAWPEGLKREFEAYARWKKAPVLPPGEARFRKKTSRESSFVTYRRHLNILVGYLVRERGFSTVTLEQLCDPALFTEFVGWYFELDANSGYQAAKGVAVTLSQVSKFLVAKGRIPERDEYGVEIWNVYYALGKRVLERGAEQGSGLQRVTAGNWKPWDLVRIAEAAWTSRPVHKGTPHAQRHRRQLVSRKRTAVIFRLAVETPLRIRNWAEMRWEEHLFLDERGRWTVHFRGEQLKVSRRGFATNVYQRSYSPDASQWIEAWRAFLREKMGDDFERKVPFVFPRGDLVDGCSEDTLRSYIEGMAYEVTGQEFNPHLFRHIVGSYAVNESGPSGLQLAADLLGDTKQTVLNTYYNPDTRQSLEEYLAEIERRKQMHS